MSERVNLLNFLTAAQPLDTVVVSRDGNIITREQFLQRVGAWQILLQKTPGEKFALFIEDSGEFAAALLGAWQADKTIYLPADTLEATCYALQADVDGFLGEFASKWQPLSPTVNQENIAFRTLSPDFVGLVVYTSGSSGTPQAILKKLSQLATEITTLETVFGEQLGSTDIIATVSHQHIYGLLFKVLWPLVAGRVIEASSVVYPETLLSMLTTRDGVLISSPAFLKRLPDHLTWETVATRVKVIFSSGGALPLTVMNQVAHLLKQTPIEIYGSSETGGIAWRKIDTLEGASWTSLPGVAWKIDTQTGLLAIQSAHLLDSDWFTLADQAVLSSEQRFYLQGRADRLVKIEEKRISLTNIENQLRQSPWVDDVHVVVLEKPRQAIAAVVVLSRVGQQQLTHHGKLTVNRALRDALTGHVETLALPRYWRYVAELPVNTQGKTTQAALVRLFDEVDGEQALLPQTQLLEKTATRALFELTIPYDLFYFDGHFDVAPILPGVVQIDWAILYSRQSFALPPIFLGIHTLKFQRVIEPGMKVLLELIQDTLKSCVNFKLTSSVGQHASGRIMLGA